MPTQRELTAEARRLAGVLKRRAMRTVLAESCTGGLVSAALTRIPGISEFHCGSAVVYRPATKSGWLGIPDEVLQDPGPVSRDVAALMAERVLQNTPEADVAASVTGHLGPDAPADQDGLLFIGVAMRKAGPTVVHRVQLEGADTRPRRVNVFRVRNRRQVDAARRVLMLLREHLQQESATV